MPSFLNSSLFSNIFKFSKPFSCIQNLILSKATECLKFKLRLNFSAFVSSSVNILGNLFTVDITSTGTFTTFPHMLNCPPLGFSRNCINGILGATKRSFKYVNSSYGGFGGKLSEFIMEHGGILFC